MSDPKAPTEAKQRIFYGSLENEVTKRMRTESGALPTATTDDSITLVGGTAITKPSSASSSTPSTFNAAVLAGIKAGNINIAGAEADTLDLSESSQMSKARQEELMKALEVKHRARVMTVPTNDVMVMKRLRENGEPICLFGEKAPARRERLRAILARISVEKGLGEIKDEKKEVVMMDTTTTEVRKKAFRTEGSAQLKEARLNMAKMALERAKQRIEQQQLERDIDFDTAAVDARYKAVTARLKSFVNSSSEIGDTRPLSCLAVAPDSSAVLTASWTGLLKLWSAPASQHLTTFKGGAEMVTDVVFHPQAAPASLSASSTSAASSSSSSLSHSAANIASCSAEGLIRLWPLTPSEDTPMLDSAFPSLAASSAPAVPEVTPLCVLKGHTERACRLAFHPSGNYLGSTSQDTTWRLWDINTQQCLLKQTGHARGVYGITFHPDGSLAVTGDMGGIGLVWDVRIGKVIWSLQGHARHVLCADFHPNGYQVATGGDDHSVRLWDIRKKNCYYTILAHTALVSTVQYQPGDGDFLLTSGFDKTVKVWSARSNQIVKILAGHDGKVARAGVAPNCEFIASAAHDRTWKLWTPEA